MSHKDSRTTRIFRPDPRGGFARRLLLNAFSGKLSGGQRVERERTLANRQGRISVQILRSVDFWGRECVKTALFYCNRRVVSPSPYFLLQKSTQISNTHPGSALFDESAPINNSVDNSPFILCKFSFEILSQLRLIHSVEMFQFGYCYTV